MSLVKPIIVSILALFPLSGEANNIDIISTTFFEVCIRSLPSIDSAKEAALRLGYKEIPLGVSQETDQLIQNPPYPRVFGSHWDGQNIALLTLAKTELDSERSTVFNGAETVSICQIEFASVTETAIVASITQRLRLDAPTIDIVNSGSRERSWETYISYKVSTIHLIETETTKGFTTALGILAPN